MLLAGRYEVLERIGEGGTAEVFRARDHRLDRILAIKVLRPQYGQDPEARARFAVEARSAAALAVPNIVPVYDFGAADDGSLFIVMRYIDGPSLRRVLSERGSLPPAEAVDVVRQVAYALAAAHSKDLVHRDVKPGNILLDAEGVAHLTDFGTVKALAGAHDLTRTGMIFGTAAYLSPEQATGGTIGPRTDLYALGAVLYEALAGRPPFDGDDPTAVAYRQAHQPPAPLAAVVPGVDRELERLVMQSLEKDPQRRPASAQAVATALESIARRLASATPAVASLGALAPNDEEPVSPRHELAKETTLISPVEINAVSPEDATARWAATAPAATSWPSGAAHLRPGLASESALPAHAGLAPPSGRNRGADASRRGGTVAGVALVALALAVVTVGTLFALNMLGGRTDSGALADVSPTARPARTAPTSAPVIIPSIPDATVLASPPFVVTFAPTPDVLPTATEPPIAIATVTQPPQPPPTPAPVATPQPTPTPTPAPVATPQPTPMPTPTPPATPQPPTAPPPAPQDVHAEIPDQAFVGDYDQGNGRYHGRTAAWVYGQGTPYHTMTARFQLTHQGQAVGVATLQLVGLDGENPIKNRMSIVLNGVTIYEGPNPLPNDECCGPSGPGNWGSAAFEFPAELLQQDNSLVISNLESADCTTCPKYVMIDYAVVEYRAQ